MLYSIQELLTAYQKKGILNKDAAHKALQDYLAAHKADEPIADASVCFLVDAMALANSHISWYVTHGVKHDDLVDAMWKSIQRAEDYLHLQGGKVYRSSRDFSIVRNYVVNTRLAALNNPRYRGEKVDDRMFRLGVPRDSLSYFYQRNPEVLFGAWSDITLNELIVKDKEECDEFHRMFAADDNNIKRLDLWDADRFISWNDLEFKLQPGDECWGHKAGDSVLSLFVVRNAPTDDSFLYPNGPRDCKALAFLYIREDFRRIRCGVGALVRLQEEYGVDMPVVFNFLSGSESGGLRKLIADAKHECYAVSKSDPFHQYVQQAPYAKK